MNVTIEAAYAEACRALGESIVTQRLLSAEVARLTPPPPPAKPPGGATDPNPHENIQPC